MVKLPNLRRVRERFPLTQAELAERAGISRVALIAIEHGESEPYPRTIRRLARALKVKPAELMGDEQDDRPTEDHSTSSTPN